MMHSDEFVGKILMYDMTTSIIMETTLVGHSKWFEICCSINIYSSTIIGEFIFLSVKEDTRARISGFAYHSPFS